MTNLGDFGPHGDNPRPSVRADGTRIAFNLRTELPGGGDADVELFLADTRAGGLTQLTHTTGVLTTDTAINANGTRIALSSDANITGGNGDHNPEIFVYDITTGAFTQLTDSPGSVAGNTLPALDADGTRVAFASDRNLVGSNPDHNQEIFLVTCAPPPPVSLCRPPTRSPSPVT